MSITLTAHLDVEPIERNGKHFVVVKMDGREVDRRGPFSNAQTAAAASERLIKKFTSKPTKATESSDSSTASHDIPIELDKPAMGNVIPFDSDRHHEFVSDLAKYADGTLDQKFIKKKWRLSDAMWETLGSNDALIEEIDTEKIRRIRTGATAREKAQVLYAEDVPTVLGDILKDSSANARHRIESAREIRAVAANGPEAAPSQDRFQITIVLNSDVERYDRSFAVNPNDIDPNTIDNTPALTAIEAKKDDDDGGGHL